jgi:hypothetical protein
MEKNNEKLEHVTNTKIMVNFEKRQVVDVKLHTASPEYRELLHLGYEEVGEYKPATKRFFWNERFFVSSHKLIQ